MKEKMWTPEKKLSYLPDFPRELFIKEGLFLYNELLNSRLEVRLRPAPFQTHADHKIRVAENHNPNWYSDIYYYHTRGKRQLFEKALWRITNRLDMDLDTRSSKHKYAYDTSIRWIIYSRFIEGYQLDDSSRVFPNNQVRAFFNLEKIEIPDEELEMGETDETQYQDRIPF
jgi:hypothetical protein